MKVGNKLSALLLFFVTLFSGTVFAETVFYCSTEHSVGYIKKGTWKQTNFQSERFTIKFSEDFSQLDGLPGGSWICHVPYVYAAPERTVCHVRQDAGSADDGRTFLFNTTNLRFIFSDVGIGGWIDDSPEPDTESLQVGSCVKF